MRIACWQPESLGDPAGLPERLRNIAARAAAAGAELLITPELSLTGYRLEAAELARAGEPANGRSRDVVGEIAARNGIAVVYGWPETYAGALFNSVQLIDSSGAVAAHYRKTHLYGPLEQSAFTPGDQPLVQAELGGLRVGLLICYDVEFPELVRLHALAGTEVLAVPTALVRPWAFVPRTLVPTRAFESQLFVAYVNWADTASDGYCGLSRVVGPDGNVLVADTDATPDALLVADLDREAVTAARKATEYLLDRRPELYGDLA